MLAKISSGFFNENIGYHAQLSLGVGTARRDFRCARNPGDG
jgi:hypothetical protein